MNDVEGFLSNVDETLEKWISTTGEPKLEWLQPMLFDFILSGDISHESIREAISRKTKWIKPQEETKLEVSRKVSRNHSENYKRDILIRRLHILYTDQAKDINTLTDIRDRLLRQKGEIIDSSKGKYNYVDVIVEIVHLYGFKCTRDNVTDALYRKKIDHSIFSNYE